MPPTESPDILLIGGGIMSAHLGAMLKQLDPRLSIHVYEAADELAAESSDGWNNAGTGHAGLCELNYTPPPATPGAPVDVTKAVEIFARFEQSRQFWSYAVAHGLAARPAEFIRADVYDYLADATPRFDLAFATYGVIGWLSDLDLWAAGVARSLRPGGRFIALEFHPIAFIFDEQLRPAYPYFGRGQPTINSAGVGDYVGASGELLTPSGWQPGVAGFRNSEPCHEFQWTIADWVSALLRAGLVLDRLVDYPHANGCQIFDNMRPLPGRRFAMPQGAPDLPLMCGLVAHKPR